MERTNRNRKHAHAKRKGRKRRLFLLFLVPAEFFLAGFLTGQFRMLFSGQMFRRSIPFGEILSEGILRAPGIFYTMGVTSLGVFLTILSLHRRGILNQAAVIGKHGERITQQGTLGRSRMLTLEEAEEHFDVSGDINDHFDFLFGSIQEDENDHARIKKIFGHRTK
ncbi:MAG: hypothetical protein IJ106_11110 [Parasporobacterium sp.]|nr:hypothetical protein [Parasporobacterium sp.]